MDVPITGVVGVVGGGPTDVARQLAELDRPADARPDAIEVRSDLFGDPARAIETVRRLRDTIPCLFTVRLSEHGGRYEGSEEERIRLYREALAAGARLLDVEWNSLAARALATEAAHLVASFHDFGAMLEERALDELTLRLEEMGPHAVKVVPTACTPSDGVDMLRWVGRGGPEGPRRVGFAMGTAGLPSRILALAWGGAWTYGALGDALAPGMPEVADLKTVYRATRLVRSTRIFGVAGASASSSPLLRPINRALAAFGLDAVYVPFSISSLDELLPVIESLPVEGLTLSDSFQRAALRFADEIEGAAREAGRAEVILVREADGGPRLIARRAPEPPSCGTLSPGPQPGPASVLRAYSLFCGLTERQPGRADFETFREAVGEA